MRLKMTKLSIITINRNNAAGLRKTIESVVSQTFTDFEYIIIDGASTDESVEVIKEYADKITYWVSEPDKGIYNAMNKGIIKANGEYLQFLNSGDWLCTNIILQSVFDLKKTEDILYGSDMLYYSENKKVLKKYPSNITFSFLYKGTISHQGTFIKRSLFDILYNENFIIVSDWEFYMRKIILENSTTYYLDIPTVYFDMHGLSMSKENEQLLWAERQQVLDKYFPKKVLRDIEELFKLKVITGYSLYQYIEPFSKLPKLQRTVKRFMKIVLWLSGNKHLIPKK